MEKIRGILKEKILRERRTIMGAAGSKLEKALGDHFPEGERYFGLENFGNTCYCNSVLQVFFYFFLFGKKLQLGFQFIVVYGYLFKFI